MKRFVMPFVLLTFASGASAAEGDVRELRFQCHVTSLDGSVRPVIGSIKDIEAKHHVGGPYLKRSVEIVDRDERLTKELNVSLGYGVIPDRNFEVIFASRSDKEASPIAAISYLRSYDFDWNGSVQSKGLLVLQNWTELRPTVRTKLTREAAGICKFEEKAAAA